MKLKIVLICLVSFLSFRFFTTETRLEQDARALGFSVADRTFCDVTPYFRGIDTIKGRYDFHPQKSEEFSRLYQENLKAQEQAQLSMTEGQRAQFCVDFRRAEGS
jgi:hypothetical protein